MNSPKNLQQKRKIVIEAVANVTKDPDALLKIADPEYQKPKNLQQEILDDFLDKLAKEGNYANWKALESDYNIRGYDAAYKRDKEIAGKVIAHTLARAEEQHEISSKLGLHYFKRADVLQEEVIRLKKERDAIKARTRAEMLKEVEDMITILRAGEPNEESENYAKLKVLEYLKNRLSTQKGGGKN